VLHLCGYDHAEEGEYAEMSRLQDEILTAMNNPLLGSISPPA
jgi:ssRNA-specific RNase YbeY (16S rRNA maturation enzyme)